MKRSTDRCTGAGLEDWSHTAMSQGCGRPLGAGASLAGSQLHRPRLQPRDTDFQLSGPQNYTGINMRCFKPPGLGALLRQPQEARRGGWEK